MLIPEIRSEIETIEKNPALYLETSFDSRAEAIDYIEFNIIERIEALPPDSNPSEELDELKQYAMKVKSRLEAIDENLFRRLGASVRSGVCTGTALKNQIDKYVRRDPREDGQHDHPGYDNLDVFVNGLLRINAVPEESKEREPEMVYYQPTPARVVMELVEKANLVKDDVFYDLGSGLGQVPILVNLLTDAQARGIEFEPAYCEYARACAADLNLSRVEFINADVREADTADGTVFFMYTPFEGKIMVQVLEKLHTLSRKRVIRLFTYGPCTVTASRQSWLEAVGDYGDNIYILGVFKSIGIEA
jgi:SAM-dependent methyltransferase